ncbi:MAG: single-stranded-DNA-specific exonuclease RecJ [Bacteroidota bacterium]
MPTPRWTLRQVDDLEAVTRLSYQLNRLPMALARTLVARGIGSYDEARHYFRDSLPALHDPFLMQDMEPAVERLLQAIAQNERVLVYGDYDVDGTTSTALMVGFLRAQGLDPAFFVPSRFIHGYGLSEAGIDHAIEAGATLIVALDCGITAHDAALYAKSKGVDLVICDHHTAGETIPEAVAVLDPKRPDCGYPFDGLSGCGVGFKLIQAVLQRQGRPEEEAWPYLDLVAVSTASDIVPLQDENRVLMRAGLERLRATQRPGLLRLAEQARVDLATATTSTIVFNLGPRINAAGRLDDATLAVDLLIESDSWKAKLLAEELEALNRQRRELDDDTRTVALAEATRFMDGDPKALVLYGADWHPGVIGITASRVAEHFHRPTVLLTSYGETNGHVKGSARSVKGINVYNALQSCSDLLERFGGHAFAAGLALDKGHIPELRARLSDAIESAVEPAQLEPEIELDAQLDLNEVDGHGGKFWRVLQQFGPFGPANRKPVFWGRDLRVVGQPSTCGADRQHLRMRVAQRDGGRPMSVIGFGLAERLPEVLQSARRGRALELAFCVEDNTWNGRTTLQLRAKDVRLGTDA